MKTITLETALQLENTLFIDVRSNSEYVKGHIPGAVSIPLLSDEERAEVGILYKQLGPETAKEKGLALTSVKLPGLIKEIKTLSKTGAHVVIYCWRGGLRSRAVVNILDLMGIKASQLVGGYKDYRQYILDSLAKFKLCPEVLVLCGSTGVGKTTVLEILREKGIPVINLEKLANHRGSVFGQIGLGQPQTAQNFDALIYTELQKLNQEPFIVVECESKRIGNVYVPDELFTAIRAGKKILLTASVETRITRLIEEYIQIFEQDYLAIKTSILALSKRLGFTKTQKLLSDLSDGNIRELVRVLLVDYYDPLYGYENKSDDNYNLTVPAESLEEASAQIIDFLDQLRK